MEEIHLDILTSIPEAVSELEVKDIRKVFPNPSLIHIEGEKTSPLFVSLMLHGNELTSFHILKKIFNYLQNHKLKRTIILFIGNVYAVEKNRRYLANQLDYNRIWLGGAKPEEILADRVKKYLLNQQKSLFACVDIHNNTGANPNYACLSKLECKSIYLAQLFSNTIVYFQNPITALSKVFSDFCPSVTLECGRSESKQGIETSFQFILDLLALDTLNYSLDKCQYKIFQTVSRVVVKENINFDFSNNNAEFSIPENIESFNFNEIIQGSVFGRTTLNCLPLKVLNDNNQDVTNDFLELRGNEIVVKKKVIGSMFTKDKTVIQQDCLGYLMQEIN